MFKATISIDDTSDLAKILKDFKTLCSNSGLSDFTSICEQVEHAVNEFSNRGAQLTAVGSQFSISRVIEGEEYKVVVNAKYGHPVSFVSKVLSAIGVK